jgi:hypothetical protein
LIVHRKPCVKRFHLRRLAVSNDSERLPRSRSIIPAFE